MPKTWLSLPEAEQLAVALTGAEPETARAQILEGIRNREIRTSGRGENGLFIWQLPGEAWAQEPDWKTSHLCWPEPGWQYAEPWGAFLVGLIQREHVERYFAPAKPLPAPARAPRAIAGAAAGKPYKDVVIAAAAKHFDQSGFEKQAEIERWLQHETARRDGGEGGISESTAKTWTKEVISRIEQRCQ